jgi:hypothetical protein
MPNPRLGGFRGAKAAGKTYHPYWLPNSRSAVRLMCRTSSGTGPMPPRMPNTVCTIKAPFERAGCHAESHDCVRGGRERLSRRKATKNSSAVAQNRGAAASFEPVEQALREDG